MNKLHFSLLGSLAVLATSTAALAVEPPTNVPPGTPAPTGKTNANTPAPAAKAAAETPPPAAPMPTPAPAAKLDEYIVELVATVNLSDKEKQQIHDLYTADGVALQNILNNDSLSPLQQAQQVSDLRDVRNAKIETILHDLDRQKAFLQVEAVYRVSLTESAADGGLVPPPPPAPPTPAPAATPPATANKPAAAPASAPSSTNAAPAKPQAPPPPM